MQCTVTVFGVLPDLTTSMYLNCVRCIYNKETIRQYCMRMHLMTWHISVANTLCRFLNNLSSDIFLIF